MMNRATFCSLVLLPCAFGCAGAKPAPSNEPTQLTATPTSSEPADPSRADDAGTGEIELSKVGPGQVGVTELVVGDGATARDGGRLSVHYTGTLLDGTVFDSSRKHGTPFEFRLGSHNVIPGWERGVEGMKVGGKRRLVIPPELAYGERGAGGVIPPNATLVFEIELLDAR